MTASTPTAQQVEAVLKGARTKSYPEDADLQSVYKFLLGTSPPEHDAASTSASGSTSTAGPSHYYCSKCSSELHREAATYLIFSFAFKRKDMASRFLDELERVLKECTSCARSFGGIRRMFAKSYLGHFPPETRKNFFAAVDKWQTALILDSLSKTASSSDIDSSPSPTTVFSLPAPIIQLLFSEPNLLADPGITANLDNAITSNFSSAQPNVTSSGLSPLLVRLLSSPREKRRSWATSQIPACGRRPLSFLEWCNSGVGDEVKNLYSGTEGASTADRLAGMDIVLSSGTLSAEVIERGVIGGQVDETGKDRSETGFMSTLSHLVGDEANHYDRIFGCFTLLLRSCPSPRLWSFDSSTELPHTLFSEIKDNKSFQMLVSDDFPQRHTSAQDSPPPAYSSLTASKGKGKEIDSETPLSWIKDFLRSLIPETSPDNKKAKESPFPQALAKVMNFCFAEMQHERWTPEASAAAAQCGFEALCDIRRRAQDGDTSTQSAFSDALQVHAKFITTIALQSKDRPANIWEAARCSAQQLLEQIFTADGRDMAESMIGLAHVAFHEKRRLKKVKAGREAPAPQPVTKLHRAAVQRELWHMAYENITAADVTGVAIFIKGVATYGHVEILDRHRAWKGDELHKVIKEEDWISAIRAINAGLKYTREGFARTLESLAMQTDTSITRSLFNIPGVPRAVIILLLSPVDELHDPVMSLIQQAFLDTDDRIDCFRALLRQYPAEAMEGLQTFLSRFIETAREAPDPCSLAKWLVRCFADVLEVLCNPSASEPLLHNEAFLEDRTGGRSMSQRISNLWQSMTESLAVIFDRTKEWAPLYENEVMVDWMRDALIFGRGMTDHIRVFEAASLGQSGSRFDQGVAESPVRITHVGKRLIEKLEKVLKHLVSWLRLTDIETLHQTFELIKTIVGRLAKSKPDLRTTDLKITLQEIDKFARKAGKNYQSKLTDDYISELADILDPFDLGRYDEEVQVVREDRSTEVGSGSEKSFKPLPPPEPVSSQKRNAFEEMMKSAGGKATPKTSSQPSNSVKAVKKPVGSTSAPSGSTSTKPKPKPTEVIDIDDMDDDSFFNNLSSHDLDVIENRAKVSTRLPEAVKPKSAAPIRHQPTAAAQKLNINVVPKYNRVPPPGTKPAGSSFKSKFMQDMRREHKLDHTTRSKAMGGMAPKLPPASGLATGLGAYTGPPRSIKRMEDSGSSASESSDENNSGIKSLVNRQKSPVKRAPLEPARRVQVVMTSADHARQQRDERRAAQQRIKNRLRPDLTPLFRYILGWDPDHTGPTPPHHDKFKDECSKLMHVPNTFVGARQYEQVMLPLFLQELWAQSQQEKDKGFEMPVKVEVSTRAYEGDFLELDFIITEALTPQWFVNETDIVVLRQPGQGGKPVLAKVQAFKRKPVNSALKLNILAVMDQRELFAKSKWQMTKYFSLSTAVREYGALRGLPHYEPELLSDILAGRATRMPHLTPSAVDAAMSAYGVNEPQAKAILGAMTVKGFALIQGPPGTGKTKTISGLVGKFLSERSTPIPVDGKDPVKPKLLVCAPSNAAIDEVCKRLMNGVPSAKGGQLQPIIVRIGIEKSVNVAVKEVSLDSLVEASVAVNSSTGVGTEYTRIQAEQAELKDRISEKMAQIQAARDHDDQRRKLEAEHHDLMAKKVELGKQASRTRDAVKDASRHLDGARRAARERILGGADIICATLSGSGHESLAPYTFETVIIDEAAQAIEMSCLIPLKYGCQRCIMVGDPNQLPPTVISEQIVRYQYNESLFVRIAKRDMSNMHLLSIQYRMHPFISELPSKVFYDGQLKDGEGMAANTAAIWHQRNTYGPYRFFNVDGIEEKKGTSTYNPTEASVAVDLYRGLLRDFGDKIDLSYRIGVITMYKEQMFELKRQFTRAFGEDIQQTIDFNTVDGFQGQEKDITILSTVRSGPALRTIGFLKDPRRMNVALTRAKSSLFVIGNAPTLERSDDRWKIIVGDARDRGFLIDYKSGETFAPAPLDAAPAPPIKKKDKVKSKIKADDVASPGGTPVVGAAKVPSLPNKATVASSNGPPAPPATSEKKVDVKPKIPVKRPSSAADSEAPQPKKPAPPKVNPPAPPARPLANGISRPSVAGQPPPRPVNGASNAVRPPPPPGRPPPPPLAGRAPPPPADDNLFVRKKKKPKTTAPLPPPPAGGPSVRDRYR